MGDIDEVTQNTIEVVTIWMLNVDSEILTFLLWEISRYTKSLRKSVEARLIVWQPPFSYF